MTRAPTPNASDAAPRTNAAGFHDISGESAFTCPRCGSHRVVTGGRPPSVLVWIVLAVFFNVFALLAYLLVHGLSDAEHCRCESCGLVSKRKFFDPVAAHRFRRTARRHPMPNRPKSIFARRA